MIDYLAELHRQPVVEWLRAKHYVVSHGGGALEYGWATRSGEDVLLRFWPLARHAHDVGWIAIIGHHASGTNPALELGTCETLAEIQETHDLIRRLNGYPHPDPDR